MKFFKLSNNKLAQATLASFLAVVAQQALANQDIEFIDISNTQSVSVAQNQLIQQAKPLKDNYSVNEPIQFVIKTNQRAYAYILANDKYGQTRQVYPNHNDKDNYVFANRNNIIPSLKSANADIVANKAGIETFTIITTTKPLQVSDLFRVAQGKSQSAPTDEVADFLKRQGVDTGNDNKDLAVTYLDVSVNANMVKVVTNKQGQAVAQPSVSKLTSYGNTLLLSSNRQSYRHNEPVNITYTATGKNYLFLGARYANGEIKSFKSFKNDKKVHQVKFKATTNITDIVLWESNKRIGGQYPDANASVFLNLKVQ